MVLGSLAAGGALGNLIPPGITFIIYGLITETSVGALYIAALLPSMLVLALFILRHHRPRPAAPAAEAGEAAADREKLKALVDLVPTLLLMLLVLGHDLWRLRDADRGGGARRGRRRLLRRSSRASSASAC